MKKILSPAYSLKLKNIILFLNRGLIFFSNGHIRNVVSTLPNVVKIDVENDNVVSTLSNVVQFNIEKHNVVSTLFDVVNFNVDVHNVVEPMLKCLLGSFYGIKIEQKILTFEKQCINRNVFHKNKDVLVLMKQVLEE